MDFKVAKVKSKIQIDVQDKELGTYVQEKVSAGQMVKAMILNCMGFLTAPLYLFSEFFIEKATEHLIGQEVKAEYLNNSRLGRVLDQLYEYGINILFLKVAFVMAKRFSLKISSAHIDGTSISVEGKYLQPEKEKIETHSTDSILKLDEDNSEPVLINITYGYSRDHRPDLKQFTLNLLTTGEEGIPLFMQVGDGNKLDQDAFPEMIKEFRTQWEKEQPDLYVVDAAFYNEKKLNHFQDSIHWISRVPLTLKSAQELTQTLFPEQFTKSTLNKDYSFCNVCNEYAGIKQLWIIVKSTQRQKDDLKNLSRRIEQSLAVKTKSLKSLESKEFACKADALSAATDFEKTLNYHLLSALKIVTKPHYQRPERPHRGDEVSHYSYQTQTTLIKNEVVIETHRNQAGRFILATNLIDKPEWTADFILQEYKALYERLRLQQPTERGCRFIKDPLFFASRVFLKSIKRIMALAMIMTRALMVYILEQRQLRQALEQTDSTLSNQKGKPTAKPTLRWIFQCFQSVHLVFVNDIKSSIKLTDKQTLILQFLSSFSHQYYFLS